MRTDRADEMMDGSGGHFDQEPVNAVPVDALKDRPADELCLGRHHRLPDSEGACEECIETTALREALVEALPVLSFVSMGRGYIGQEPYPDARARRVLAQAYEALPAAPTGENRT